MSKLLTREQFREGVFKRAGDKCVCCEKPGVDAHHILERRLFTDGGYYLDNGALVCEEHHKAAEMTTLSVEELREKAGITKPVLPEHVYEDQVYDKWGNIILPNGQRLKGELFGDESVQKILKEGKVLDLFVNHVKYGRTHHLPWSMGKTEDDRTVKDLSVFEGKRIIVTEKMDGENSSLYSDGLHARSVDSKNHPSRNWLKAFHAKIQGDIPEGWRVCGENLFAKHSLGYEDLPSYFMGFSVWDEKNFCLDWDTTQEWFEMLGIVSVPVLYDGIFDEKVLKDIAKNLDTKKTEGYCVRIADGFTYGQFRTHIAKFVRQNHVQTTAHWMHGKPVEPNKLKDDVVTTPRKFKI